MPEMTTEAATLRLIGGALCLDFVNTVEDYRGEPPHDHLSNYTELVAWSRHAAILTPRLAEQLTLVAARRREEAGRVHLRALALRATLHRLFTAQLVHHNPQAGDLAALNKILPQALSQGWIRSTENGYTWDWTAREDDLAQMLYPIARSAGDLLTSDNLGRVRECEDDTCGWLFVDTSRNHSRRWCSMEDCGNRAKARRHYRLARNK
jgi:predicted RNA-binding Zn ribbon-like protein